MQTEAQVLPGRQVRLEPLQHRHIDGLVAAAAGDRSLYQWSAVPHGKAEFTAYVDTALSWREAGTAAPFAIVRVDDGAVIGSTRFWNVERWSWPPGHARHGRQAPDACEIGHTWLGHSAIRTAANTEAKLLLLTHAFETWQVLRVCFHTDARNQRSRAALERIGAQYEGLLRAHRMAADYTARDSLRFSIVAAEWPQLKQRLVHLSPTVSDAMPPLDHLYQVRDAQGRLWGSVRLEWPHDNCLSGRLLPEAGFEQVRGLFKRHADLLGKPVQPGDVEVGDAGTQIAQLGVTLLDQASGRQYAVGPVSVSESLLFTCSF